MEKHALLKLKKQFLSDRVFLFAFLLKQKYVFFMYYWYIFSDRSWCLFVWFFVCCCCFLSLGSSLYKKIDLVVFFSQMGLARKQLWPFLPRSTHNRWGFGPLWAVLAILGCFWPFWAVLILKVFLPMITHSLW